MPLLDHFRPPYKSRLPWESLHNGWLSALAERLNTLIPPEYVAIDRLRFGRELEVDIGTLEEESSSVPGAAAGPGTAVQTARYVPPPAAGAVSVALADVSEVQVFVDDGGRRLVAAVELVSPANKDRRVERQAFAAKCVAYLTAGVSVVVLDAVTTRRAVLHNDILAGLDADSGLELPAGTGLYAVSYRPTVRGETAEVEVWFGEVAVGDPLPTMPLRLTGDLFVPVEFEPTYTDACRKRKLIP